VPSKKAPRTEHLSQEQKLTLPADLIQAMAQAKLERSQFPPPPAPDPKDFPIDWKAFALANERFRKLELLAKSSPEELRYVEEMLARLGQDFDHVDLKLALAETLRHGSYGQVKVQLDKAFAGLPADAPLPQLLNRLGIPMRKDRSIPCPGAVTRIHQALKDMTLRAFACRTRLDESTIRKVLKKERAEPSTLEFIAKAMNMSLEALNSDQEPPSGTHQP
jgi:hypothetical protein